MARSLRSCIGAMLAASILGQAQPPKQPEKFRLSARDDAFLEDLERRSFQYFLDHTDPKTGITRDRARADGSEHRPDRQWVGSIAAIGFGLTSLCIAAERGWISRVDARDRIRRALRFFAQSSPHERGWFYHFVDIRTGERVWNSELSSIDTALLLAGVLTARQCMNRDPEIPKLATAIYERIDFPWMMNGGDTLTHGWRPESGFIRSRWDTYSEHPVLYLMAIGSPAHPIKPEAWWTWNRNWTEYKDFKYLGRAGLFTHQYSHAWVDFRGRREDREPHVDYFENSVTAMRAHRQFCIDLRDEFPGYSENIWGITASDSQRGYVGWTGPPRHPRTDGTVVPYAAAGALMFTPDIALAALHEMKNRFGEKIYGKYGFADAFHPTSGWVNADVIGIDLGITILAAENLRSARVWRWFMANREIPAALARVGLTEHR